MTTKEFNNKISAIALGDKDAMKGIYDEYYAFIYFTALSYVRDKMTAEDVASEVMIDLFSPRKKIEYVNNPKTFLYVMTINRCKNLLKSKNYNNEEIIIDLGNDELKNDFYSVEIGELLLKLSELDRNIFVAHIFWGFTFAEISKRFAVSIVTVKRKYKKVCEYMIKHLNN